MGFLPLWHISPKFSVLPSGKTMCRMQNMIFLDVKMVQAYSLTIPKFGMAGTMCATGGEKV